MSFDISGSVDFYSAITAAGHEFKGIAGYSKANVEGLNVPLIALIDYRGFRLIAMSLLPISRDTIQCNE